MMNIVIDTKQIRQLYRQYICVRVKCGFMVNVPNDNTNHSTDTTDAYFEREVHLSRELTARFLRELADQIDNGTELTVSGDDWKIPFEYREPIEIEVELTSHHGREFEIEFKFNESQEKGGLSVE
jgi:amphi-Trp domain-containing protein